MNKDGRSAGDGGDVAEAPSLRGETETESDSTCGQRRYRYALGTGKEIVAGCKLRRERGEGVFRSGGVRRCHDEVRISWSRWAGGFLAYEGHGVGIICHSGAESPEGMALGVGRLLFTWLEAVALAGGRIFFDWFEYVE